MHAGHEKTIVMLKEDIKTLPESSYLRALVSKTLPILAQHSVVATNMHKKVNEI